MGRLIFCLLADEEWGLRDYGYDGQIGLESHPQEYIDKLVQICREIRRVLKKSGSFYFNIGDTYFGGKGKSGSEEPDEFTVRKKQGLMQGKASTYQGDRPSDICKQDGGWLKPKQLLLVPSRVAIALQDDGWILRNVIIWHKPNPMPSSVKDRLNNTFEYVFHFVKSRKYYYDLDAIREPHSTESLKDLNRRKSMRFIINKNVKSATGKTNPCDKWDRRRDEYYHPEGRNPGDVIYKEPGSIAYYEACKKSGHYGEKRPIEAFRHLRHPKGRNPGDFWEIYTQPFTGYNPELEHFSVFPEAIVERPLKASCPKQVCKKCGKPRERISKKIYESAHRRGDNYTHREGTDSLTSSKACKEGGWNELPALRIKEIKTLGWTDCGCGEGFDGGVVLDPFCGRGTVGKVAKKLGLHYILFDIKPDYCELSRLYIGGQKYKVPKTQMNLDSFA